MDSHEEFDVIKEEKMWRFHNLCFAILAVVLEEAVLQAEVSIINVLKNCGGLFLLGVFICFIHCSTQWNNQEFWILQIT